MGKVLVTGGAQRLGREICLALADRGHSLVIHYRNSLELAKKVVSDCKERGGQAEIIYGDFSTHQATNDFIEEYHSRFSDTQGIVHNVGNYWIGPLLQTSFAKWESLFQVNCFAPFLISQSLISSLVKYQGSIIHIGNVGVVKGGPKKNAPAYFMTKESLWQLTQSLALELAPYHVNVNMVSPGMLENSVDLSQYIDKLPMKRAGKLSEVASLVVFLMEEKNRYITGQNIDVAGAFEL